MKSKIVVVLICIMMIATIFVSAGSNVEVIDFKNISDDIQSTSYDDDVPTWKVGTVWTYKIENFDFTLDETEGRTIDIHLKAGNLKVKVASESLTSYRTEFEVSNIDLEFDIYFDLGIEDKDPLIISGEISDVSMEGNIYFDKNDLGIDMFDCSIKIEIGLDSLPINLSMIPPILLLLIPPITITINLEADFDEHFTLIDFPLHANKIWTLPRANVTVDGAISSFWLRILNIVNKIASIVGMDFIPPELAKFLPVIDISEVLNAFNISNKIEIQLPTELYGSPLFECVGQETITVEAGTYNAYDISIVDDVGNIYYSPEIGTIVKITGNFNDIIPFMEDINIELIDVEEEQNIGLI